MRVEFGGDGADAKSEDEKIESVERPAQKAGDEGVALQRSEPPEMCQKFYGSLLRSRRISVSDARTALLARAISAEFTRDA